MFITIFLGTWGMHCTLRILVSITILLSMLQYTLSVLCLEGDIFCKHKMKALIQSMTDGLWCKFGSLFFVGGVNCWDQNFLHIHHPTSVMSMSSAGIRCGFESTCRKCVYEQSFQGIGWKSERKAHPLQKPCSVVNWSNVSLPILSWWH